ncbi:MAG: cytochrome b [Rhodopila sp.]
MSMHATAQVARIAAGDDRVRYDGFEMALHWATAALVVTNYLLAQIWDFLQRGTPVRHEMQSLHVSLGLLLAVVLVARIAWRAGPGRRLPPATTGLIELASQAVHCILYGLVITVVSLGLCFRWAQGEPLAFFGLFAIPSPYPFVKAQAHTIGAIHNWVANIIILAGLHAAAALFHHFVLRDDVLWRMLPGIKARVAEARAPDAREASSR